MGEIIQLNEAEIKQQLGGSGATTASNGSIARFAAERMP